MSDRTRRREPQVTWPTAGSPSYRKCLSNITDVSVSGVQAQLEGELDGPAPEVGGQPLHAAGHRLRTASLHSEPALQVLFLAVLFYTRIESDRAESSIAQRTSTLTPIAQQYHHGILSQHTSQCSCSSDEGAFPCHTTFCLSSRLPRIALLVNLAESHGPLRTWRVLCSVCTT